MQAMPLSGLHGVPGDRVILPVVAAIDSEQERLSFLDHKWWRVSQVGVRKKNNAIAINAKKVSFPNGIP